MPDQIELLGYSRDLGDFLSEGIANSRVAPYVEPPEKKHHDQTLIPRIYADEEEDIYDGPFAVRKSDSRKVVVKDNFYANIWNKYYIDRMEMPDSVVDFSAVTDFSTNYYVILRMGADGIELGYMKSDEWHAYVITRIAEVSFNQETGEISRIVQLFNSHLSPSSIYILGSNGAPGILRREDVFLQSVSDRNTLLMYYYDGPGACLPISDNEVLVKGGEISSSYVSGNSTYYRMRENTIVGETVTLSSAARTMFNFCWHEGKLEVTHDGQENGYTRLCRIATFRFDGEKITSTDYYLWNSFITNTGEKGEHLGREYTFRTCNEDGLFFNESRLAMEWYDAENLYIGWRGKYQKVNVSGLSNPHIYYSPVLGNLLAKNGNLNVEPYVGKYPSEYNLDFNEQLTSPPYYAKDENTLVLNMSGVYVRCSSWRKRFPDGTVVEVPWGGERRIYVKIKLELSGGTLVDDFFIGNNEPTEDETTAYIDILRIEPSGHVRYNPGPYNFYWRCY